MGKNSRELTWDDASSAIVLIFERKGMHFKKRPRTLSVLPLPSSPSRFPIRAPSSQLRHIRRTSLSRERRVKKNPTLASGSRSSHVAQLNDVERNTNTQCIYIYVYTCTGIYMCVYTVGLVQRRGEAEREKGKDRANEAPRIESRPNLRR